ncbi:MAG: ribbon-helix-helix domain-containing protein [Promethearchaeota archaeon]
MKTITIKLPEDEAELLDIYVQKKNFPSKSEFIRNLIRQKIEQDVIRKEEVGWMILAEQSLEEIWDNKEDDKIWQNYL